MKSIERVLLLVLLGVAIFDHAGPARAGGDARSLSANEFTLVSDQGKPMGSFHISADGLPELVLVDGMGRGRIVLAVKRNDDALIAITDTVGRVRAGLVGEADGRHSVAVYDEAMVPRLSLSAGNKGLPRMFVLSDKKKKLVSLEVDEHEIPRLSITNESGDTRLEYGPGTSLGVFGLYLLGSSATPRVGLEIDESSIARVFTQDITAKMRAELQASNDALPLVTLRDRSGRKLPIK